jgi:hypothetical protein
VGEIKLYNPAPKEKRPETPAAYIRTTDMFDSRFFLVSLGSVVGTTQLPYSGFALVFVSTNLNELLPKGCAGAVIRSSNHKTGD